MTRRHLVLGSLLAGLGFAGAWLGVRTGTVKALDVDVSWQSSSPGEYRPQSGLSAGSEIALVFVGSPSCMWSNAEGMPEAIQAAKRRLQQRADSLGYEFAAVGVVKTHEPSTGMDWLRSFGRFDEVLTGRGWANTGLMKYVHHQFPGRPSTPQVVITRRTVEAEPVPAYVNEQVLLRHVGSQGIQQWVEAGAPLPELQRVAADN